MMYIPRIHTGTPDEIITGLMDEAADIAYSGMMRMHAQGRELDRIAECLRALGGDLLVGAEEDEGFILLYRKHLPGCKVDDSNLCYCPFERRIQNPV